MPGNKWKATDSTSSTPIVANNGVLKNPNNGQWVKGTKSPNPSGRPVKKRDALDKLMKNFYGPDCEALLLDVIEIAQYNSKEDRDINWPGKLYRFFIPKFTNIQVADARKYLFDQYFGKSVQENKTEISTPDDIKIQIQYVDSDNVED